MRSRNSWLLAMTGLTFVAVGVWLLLMGSGMTSAQVEDYNYIGASECGSCHRSLERDHEESAHGLTLQDAQRDQERILASFAQDEAVRTVTLPGEDEARPFTADDIAYVVGAGGRIQRYLYEAGRDEWYVLPAEWDVEAGAWQPLTLAENWPDPAYDWAQNCAYCHVTALDIEDGDWEEDGVQCEACHGPGSEHAYLADEAGSRASDEELAALRGAINNATDPQVCGQCHSSGVGADNHPYPVGYLPGLNLSEYFTLHLPDDSAHWYPSGHGRTANMQYNEWSSAGHSRALANLLESGAEIDTECLACHSADYAYTQRLIELVDEEEREGDPPDLPTAETAQHGVTCASCHNPHIETELPANLIEATDTLCISCHSTANFSGEGIHHPVREMFEGTTLIENIPGRENAHFIVEDGPTCSTCHLPVVPIPGDTRVSHALRIVAPGDALDVEGLTDTCSACHTEAATPQALQQLIDDIQTDARQRIETARANVGETTPDWVVQALDFVEGDGSEGIHNYAYADALLDAVYIELGLFDAAEETE